MEALDKLILSFGSLIYLMILILVFFSKKRHLTFQNKLYHYLLITSLVLLVVEIVTGYVDGFRDGNLTVIAAVFVVKPACGLGVYLFENTLILYHLMKGERSLLHTCYGGDHFVG